MCCVSLLAFHAASCIGELLHQFSEYCAEDIHNCQRVWNGVHSALVRINEELLQRKVAALV
jgi:hypothetical protein